MGRHSHNGTGPVFHECKVGRIYGDTFAAQGINAVSTEKYAFLFIFFHRFIRSIQQRHFIDKRRHLFFLRRALRKLKRQRMFRSQTHKGCTENRIVAGRKYRNDDILVFNRKTNLSPDAFSDPVFLHRGYFFRPSGQLIGMLQQIGSIICCAKKPLPQLFLANLLTTTPA